MASLGSLFTSEVLHFAPCTLCWYQRMAMYPLAIIFTAAFFKREKRVYFYVLPFCLLGLTVSIFQNWQQAGLLTSVVGKCLDVFFCRSMSLDSLAYVILPVMGMGTFGLIGILGLWDFWNRGKMVSE